MKKSEIIELVKQGHKIITSRGVMGMKPAAYINQVCIRKDTACNVIRELGLVTEDKYDVKHWGLPQ